MKTKRQADTIKAAISAAIKATRKAEAEINGDTRTACTDACWHISEASRYLDLAADWYKNLLREERENEKPEPPPKPVEAEELACAICENEIERGDDTDCSGCDRKICPACMGDSGVCLECEADE